MPALLGDAQGRRCGKVALPLLGDRDQVLLPLPEVRL